MIRTPNALAICLALVALATGGALAGCDDAAARDAKHDPARPSSPLLVFGQTGLGPGDFSCPRAIAVGPDDRVYVVDKSARVQRFAPDGKYESGWQMPEWSAGKPTGMSFGPDGNLHIADTHYYRIMIYDRDGRHLGQFGSKGTGPGEFIFATDLAFDADGNLYISEYGGNDRISKFDRDRRFIRSFGGPDAGEASLMRPQSICFDRDQTLWVADACKHRICRFNRDGELLSQFGKPGSQPGELRYPYAVTVTSDGDLLVTEYGNNRLQRFSRDGRSLATLGGPGRESGQFAFPWSAALTRDGRSWVVDSGNNRIQVFKF